MSNVNYEMWLSVFLRNFSVAMFVLAVFFIIVHRLIVGKRVSEYEIVFRWMTLFALGFTAIYACVMHLFFSEEAARTIGWQPSPFQFEIAMANLAIGVLGILAFRASYGFRLATVIAAICFLWGAALVHIEQIIMTRNFSPGNAGSWLIMDIIVPFILLICIIKLRPGPLIPYEQRL